MTAEIQTAPRTIAELPFFAAGRFPKPDLIGQCKGGHVEHISGRGLVDRVRDLGLGLSALGLRAGDRVALMCESRPEWLVADFAILTAGAVSVPVYPTLSVDQAAAILRDSGASIVFVSTAAQLAKVLASADVLPALRLIVTIDAPADASARVPVVTYEDVASRGHRRIMEGWGVGREFQERSRQVRPEDLATIIYTSGTTGEPKGVMLTHGNLVANVTGILDVIALGPDDTALSFLPLCHGFERLVAYVYLTSGVSMVFAESLETISVDLLAVRPTVMTGVPRVFEKLRARALERGRQGSWLQRRVFDWAVSVAEAKGRALAAPPSIPARIARDVAERLVYSRVRAALGGRLRFAVSGSAPLGVDVARFFYGFGLPLLEGYGLTETSPVICVMPLGKEQFGTVGPPLPNVEVTIAEDGEVLTRGPHVMTGYYHRPQETEAALAGGWFHTGDIGQFDERGYLQITDRKKELLVTSGGKKIAPQPIEERLRAHPLIEEVMLVGEGRHFPAALIVPDFAALASRLGLDAAAVPARVGDADVRALYEPVVEAANAQLSQFQRIKKFALLSEPMTMAGGELTPTFKIKRRVVEAKYRSEIDALYATATPRTSEPD